MKNKNTTLDGQKDNYSSITILRDGETFEPTGGTIVVEFDEDGISPDAIEAVNDGDPRALASEIMSDETEGKPNGRILSVSRLVDLYDAIIAQDSCDGLHGAAYEAFRKVENLD